MVEIHNVAADVDARDGANQVEENQGNQWVKNDLCVVQKCQRTVAKKCNVAIVDHRNQVKCVAEKACNEIVLTDKDCKQ